MYFKKHKKNTQSPYCTSGSYESSNEKKSLMSNKAGIEREQAMRPINKSNNSRYESDSPDPPIKTAGITNLRVKPELSNDKKEPEVVQKVKENDTLDAHETLQIIEDYGDTQEKPAVEKVAAKVIKPSQKLENSMLTVSSPSRGSVLTNPQQPGGRFGSSLNNSNTQDQYPIKPGKAMQIFKNVLTEHERREILDYREIY